MGYESLPSLMTEGGCQVEASLWTSVILHLFHENVVGNKNAGGRKKVAHPSHREPSVGPRTGNGEALGESQALNTRKRGMFISRLR